MKNILFTLSLLLIALLPNLAPAADYSKMSVNVPDGWTAMDQGDTLTIYSGDMSLTATITISNSNGISAEDYAAQAARNGGMGAPQASHGGHLLQNNAAPDAWVYITVINNRLIVANMMGNRDTLLVIVSSARPK